MISPDTLKDLPVIAIMASVMLAGIWLFARSLLPSISFMTDAQAKAVQAQAIAAKNTEDTYEKRLAANNELMKQQFITYNMERDQERNAQLSKLRDEINSQNATIATLVAQRNIDHGKIDVLEKKSAILDESNTAKDKLIESLSAQVATLQSNLDAITLELGKRVEQIAGLDARIATLIGMPPASEATVVAA